MTNESRDEITKIMESNEGLGGECSFYDENDEDWGNSFDDQDSGYWEDYLGGPDDSEIESHCQNQHSQTFEHDFLEYEAVSTPLEDCVPSPSDSEIERNNYQEGNEEDIEKYNLYSEIAQNKYDLNLTDDSTVQKNLGHINLSFKSVKKNKEIKIHTKLLEYARIAVIYFFIFSFFAVGFSDLFGFSLKTNLVGKIIDWTVLVGASVYGIVCIIGLIGFACFVIFHLSKHTLALFSRDPNERHLAWTETENSFKQLGKAIWTWTKIICFIVGALTILIWI